MDATRQAVEDADLSKLNDKDKAELRHFLSLESKRSEIQANTHALTEVCWKKCITGTIRGGKLDKSEETCLTNCVERILDINFLTVKHLEKMRQQ
ncbi:probable Mitochondrial import inner membrane translocase subunit TIM8 [Cephalotrichum gorgonifer]|uniref:Mitochondrial import inner membrane translocase subunit n=1 Tax=Cephalotrichum gorgonifer TaxID=2041049 RepID=A0AAE8SRR9_9PEZI|nr:probable Mitochondrial import inner membrane translocase subunit TIM8 [Cephalotrichum gorgonifer]